MKMEGLLGRWVEGGPDYQKFILIIQQTGFPIAIYEVRYHKNFSLIFDDLGVPQGTFVFTFVFENIQRKIFSNFKCIFPYYTCIFIENVT